MTPPTAASALEYGAFELVSALDERLLETLDEDAEVGVLRPGVHL